MKTHLLQRTTTYAKIACGNGRLNHVQSTLVLADVDCKLCLGTDVYARLLENSKSAQDRIDKDLKKPRTVRVQLPEGFAESIRKMTKSLEGFSIFGERCKTCKKTVNMMVAKGTGFCSSNCKDNYNPEENA